MSGYKVFQNGDILDANTDVNPFLMRQTVMVFEDAADRTAQLDGDELEGMVTYLKDVAHLQRYDGSDWVAAAGLVEIVTFTGDADFEKGDYPWLRAVRVRCQGGGGGGAGAQADPGEQVVATAGSGGGYSESFIADLSTVTDPISVTVGAGGARGAAGQNAGANGGASSFGSLVVANGGSGGGVVGSFSVPITFIGTPGAAPGTGDIAAPGQASIGPFGLSGTQGTSGQGGDSVLGAGGGARVGSGGAGLDASGFGAGGGGAKDRDNTARAGGAGAPGIVIVELYA